MGKDWDNFSDSKRKDTTAERARANADKEKLRQYQQGATPFGYSHGTGKTTKQEREAFISFMTDVMAECLRVLKPGGHALVWALPRTSHWTATAIEDAGFEIRDIVTHVFGSGFPKSMDISKAIDKMQGTEREVIGIQSNHRNRPQTDKWDKSAKVQSGFCLPGQAHKGNLEKVTAPATPEARQHAGTGTALKPANEHWILARKPLSEKSIAANVLKWGTGGLAIDQCRVGTHDYTQEQWNKKGEACTTGNAYGVHKGSITPLPQGRFPSNLLLSHSLFCTPLGTRKVKGNGPSPLGKTRQTDDIYALGLAQDSPISYRDEDGMEEVQAWDCDPSCPVYQLDLQSGIRKSGGVTRNNSHKSGMWLQGYPDTFEGYTDQGGASRYFSQFCPQDEVPIPFLYQSKASRTERNRGCEGLPEGYNDWQRETSGLNQDRPNREGRKPMGPQSNHHPTVKPLALMSWLCRLITPPGGTVLDCFVGSGSTLCAAIYEGFHFIGIEQEASYVEIARARVRHAWEVQP